MCARLWHLRKLQDIALFHSCEHGQVWSSYPKAMRAPSSSATPKRPYRHMLCFCWMYYQLISQYRLVSPLDYLIYTSTSCIYTGQCQLDWPHTGPVLPIALDNPSYYQHCSVINYIRCIIGSLASKHYPHWQFICFRSSVSDNQINARCFRL